MPTYAYRCAGCGHAFEQVQRMVDEPLTDCPECGAAIRRVIYPVGVVFKGSGWYINDSRKKQGGDESGKSDEKPSGEEKAKKSDADTAKKDGAKKKEPAAKSEKSAAD
ncbi:MAG: zinc ribbon domain-containing protein [Chloroflexia bacterium]|nr:zinc ribbon domain-containing protein [Chloroflexia bacterium]